MDETNASTSATKRKFSFRQMSNASESTEGDGSSTDVKTTILRCDVLSALVEDLLYTLYGCATLVVCAPLIASLVLCVCWRLTAHRVSQC